jgi:integrase
MSTANADSGWRAQRLGIVRCFARYLHAFDPKHQVPPAGLLHRGRRPAPFIYAEADVLALMAAAGRLRSPLRALTMATLIALLAVTGLRVGEIIRLDTADVDGERGLLTVRNSKLGRSRHVPLHPSTSAALDTYLRRRHELVLRPSSPALFISTAGTRLGSGNLRAAFAEVLDHARLPRRDGGRAARLGDLRHSFAVRTLHDWHLNNVDVGARLPVLSTYLGHVSPASTYWYLTATPVLLQTAARRRDQVAT